MKIGCLGLKSPISKSAFLLCPPHSKANGKVYASDRAPSNHGTAMIGETLPAVKVGYSCNRYTNGPCNVTRGNVLFSRLLEVFPKSRPHASLGAARAPASVLISSYLNLNSKIWIHIWMYLQNWVPFYRLKSVSEKQTPLNRRCSMKFRKAISNE